MRQLTVTPFNPRLLPDLQTLSISSADMTINFIELHSMLRLCTRRDAHSSSGWDRSTARLRSIMLLGQASEDEGIPLRQDLRAQGMKNFKQDLGASDWYDWT
jgi:hypothetical protein